MIPDIYLHFMDRQLQESLDAPMTEEEIIRIILLSLLMSNNIYVSFTHICATSLMYPNVNKIMNELQKNGTVSFLLSANSGIEYIYKSQERYKNNRKRYPFYFDEKTIINVPVDCIPRRLSSTEYIRNGLRNILIDENYKSNDIITKIIKTYMPQDQWEALTIDAFSRCFDDSSIFGNTNQLFRIKSRNDMRRLLNCLHHESLIQETGASIITNILKCQYYDRIDDESPYDFQIYNTLLTPFVFYNQYTLKERIKMILDFRKSQYWDNTVKELYDIADSVRRYCDLRIENKNIYIYKIRVLKDIYESCVKAADKVGGIFSNLPLYFELVKFYLKEKGIEYVMKEHLETRKILLVVATKLELTCLLDTLKKNNLLFTHITKGNLVIYMLKFTGSQIYIIASQSGSTGSGGATLSIYEAVKSTNPDMIILGGIAFGARQESQKLGDILVSKQIWSYEPERVSMSGNKSRGDKITANPMLLNIFTSSSVEWTGANVEFGLIASGEKLVDSKKFLNQLKKREPEIIGGEMEGTALVSVGQNTLKPWIMVKAICDWGYRKTCSFQMQAAQNAFEYILYTIQQFGWR